jgi:hypothetical protein
MSPARSENGLSFDHHNAGTSTTRSETPTGPHFMCRRTTHAVDVGRGRVPWYLRSVMRGDQGPPGGLDLWVPVHPAARRLSVLTSSRCADDGGLPHVALRCSHGPARRTHWRRRLCTSVRRVRSQFRAVHYEPTQQRGKVDTAARLGRCHPCAGLVDSLLVRGPVPPCIDGRLDLASARERTDLVLLVGLA